jgi:hypothetical protein
LNVPRDWVSELISIDIDENVRKIFDIFVPSASPRHRVDSYENASLYWIKEFRAAVLINFIKKLSRTINRKRYAKRLWRV